MGWNWEGFEGRRGHLRRTFRAAVTNALIRRAFRDPLHHEMVWGALRGGGALLAVKTDESVSTGLAGGKNVNETSGRLVTYKIGWSLSDSLKANSTGLAGWPLEVHRKLMDLYRIGWPMSDTSKTDHLSGSLPGWLVDRSA